MTAVCRQIVPFLLVLLADLAIITYWPPLTAVLGRLVS
jgi:TRAP-type C4-dicarboxylate transport system permease large subunit